MLVQIWMMAVMHIDKVVLQGLAECVETSSKLKGFMSSMANAAKSADKRQAKRGLSADGCMQLGAEVSHLVRLIALAQPNVAGAADVYTLMTVNKWAEVRSSGMHLNLPTRNVPSAYIYTLLRRYNSSATSYQHVILQHAQSSY